MGDVMKYIAEHRKGGQAANKHTYSGKHKALVVTSGLVLTRLLVSNHDLTVLDLGELLFHLVRSEALGVSSVSQ